MSLRSFYLSFKILVNFSILSKNFYSRTGCGIKNIFNSCLKYFHVPLYFPILEIEIYPNREPALDTQGFL